MSPDGRSFRGTLTAADGEEVEWVGARVTQVCALGSWRITPITPTCHPPPAPPHPTRHPIPLHQASGEEPPSRVDPNPNPSPSPSPSPNPSPNPTPNPNPNPNVPYP